MDCGSCGVTKQRAARLFLPDGSKDTMRSLRRNPACKDWHGQHCEVEAVEVPSYLEILRARNMACGRLTDPDIGTGESFATR